jgi:hypothetical protein
MEDINFDIGPQFCSERLVRYKVYGTAQEVLYEELSAEKTLGGCGTVESYQQIHIASRFSRVSRSRSK